jgi:hypothetical protein
MAKLLPSSKSSTSSIVKADKFLNFSKPSAKIAKISPISDTVKQIENKVIQVDKLLKDSLLLSKKEGKKTRIKKEGEEFSEREKDLEKKLPKPEKGVKLPSTPKLGFFGWIKNFITQTILGFLAVRLIGFLPQLLKILPVIINVSDFIIDWGGKLLDGLITFVDWGYKAIDGTRGFIKNIGGEGLAQNFDKFAGAIDNLIEVAVIAALVTAGSDSFGGRDRVDPKKGFDVKGGRVIGKEAQRRYAQRFGREQFIDRFGKNNLGNLQGGVRRGAFQRGARNAFVGLAGKGGAKQVLNFVRPLTKRLPIIGGLLDFGLSVALGEDPGRAAFKAIGATLFGALGAAIGSLAFGAGAIVGGILGGIGGDALGGALYDILFRNKKPTQKQAKTNKLAGGGKPVSTRGGGKTVSSSPRRTLKKKKPKRTISFIPRKIKPGANTGGEEKVRKVFPNPEKSWWDPFGLFTGKSKEQPQETKKPTQKTTNPQEFLVKSNDDLGRADFFGPFFTIALKSVLGQKPDLLDYRNAGKGLNSWIQTTFKSGVLGFAGGGEVDAQKYFEGEDYTNIIAKTVEDSVSKEVDTTIRNLSKELSLRPVGREEMLDKNNEPSDEATDEDVERGGLTSGKWGPLLDLISSVESAGGSYDSRYGGIYPGYSKLTIAQADAVQKANYRKWGSAASGKYQFMNIAGQAAYAGLKPNDLFSPENQDKMAIALIEKKRYGRDWLSGKISDPEFAKYLSMEWAGLPRGNDNLSYYHGDGRNKAHTTFDKVLKSLSKVKQGGYSKSELSKDQNIKMGKGYGKGGQKIAGDLGDFMKANRSKLPVTGDIHRHPRHPPWEKTGHTAGSLHYQGRAIDLGGWAPSNRNSGGRDEQAPVIKAILEWNKKNGYSPVELIHHSPRYKNVGSYRADHNDHVHVAYARGGETLDGPHIAMVGEEGTEYVIDADSYREIEKVAPGLLDILNYDVHDRNSLKKYMPSIINSLTTYMDYEQPYAEPEIFEVPIIIEVPVALGGEGSTGTSITMMRDIDNSVPGMDILDAIG